MKQRRIAIIDDDPFVIKHLSEKFRERMPGVDVVGISNPIAPIGFDVYIIDREFGEDSCGQDLVKRVNQIEPNSLVIAYSAYLDRDFLRSLVLESCEGAFYKGCLEEVEKMIELIEIFFETGQLPKAVAGGKQGTVRSIVNLIREWNTRLARSGQAAAKYHGNVQ